MILNIETNFKILSVKGLLYGCPGLCRLDSFPKSGTGDNNRK